MSTTTTPHPHEGAIERLRQLDQETARLRAELDIHQPGEIIFKEEQSIDRTIQVRADGYGKATIEVVEGEGDNAVVHGSLRFRTERAACEQAERLSEAAGDESDLEDFATPDAERD